jgi:hypothetical protein
MQDRASTSGQPHVAADYVLMLQARSGDQCAGVKLHAHFEAGADHVCIQVLGSAPGASPIQAWRILAKAMLH